MTMLISKFHRLIQSRLLWGAFLVIIIFSFVVWGMMAPKDSARAREAVSEGMLNGKPVSPEEFRHAYLQTYMGVNLMMGRPINVNEKIEEQLRKATWRRLVSLKEAENIGITANDAEVVAAIQQTPDFSENGRFSPPRYNSFVQSVLGSMRVDEMAFEEHIREEIILQKLRHMISQTAVVTPFELKRAFGTLSDEFTLNYVVVTTADVEKSVSVGRAEAEAFFLKNPAAFTIPEKVRVKYVTFSAKDYVNDVRTNITEDAALAYYDEHMDDYPNTNTVAVAAATNAASTNALTAAVQPFDQVRTNIVATLTQEAALNRAGEVATEFVVGITPDREGNAPKFDEAAARSKRVIQKAGPFAAQENVEAVDAGPAFNRAVFHLNMQPDENFSDAIIGKEHVYVAALEARIPSRVPKFDEVASNVTVIAHRQAVAEALTKKAQAVRDAAAKAVEQGRSFEEAIQPFGLKPLVTPPVTVSSEDFAATNEYAEVLLRGVLVRNQGEVSDLLPTEGAVLVAYVAKRTPGSPAAFDTLRPQLIQMLRRQRLQWLFEDWQESLLARGSLVDRLATTKEETSEEEEAPAPKHDTSQYQ